jgi:hypothetical protein
MEPSYNELLNYEVKPKTDDPFEDRLAISSRIDRCLSTDRYQRALFERERLVS